MQRIGAVLRAKYDMRTEDAICSDCGKQFTIEYLFVPSVAKEYATLDACYECTLARRSLRQRTPPVILQKPQEKLQEEWKRICPIGFRDTNPMQIPDALRRSVLSHSYSSRGFCIVGPSGTFKSRVLYLLMETYHYLGKRVLIYDSSGFVDAVLESFRDDTYHRFVTTCSYVDAFYLDDLGQHKFHDRVEEAFFTILDRRVMSGKPTFLSSNLEGKALGAFFSPLKRDPILRRMRESMRVESTRKYAQVARALAA